MCLISRVTGEVPNFHFSGFRVNQELTLLVAIAGGANLSEVRRFNVELRREELSDVPAILSLTPDVCAFFVPASSLRSYLLRKP